MRVKFLPLARRDVFEASDYYEARRHRLGTDFVDEVGRVALLVGRSHKIGEKVDDIHRRVPLRRFPYALVYRRDGDVVLVVAVPHRRRKPQYWQYRVQDNTATYVVHA